MISRRIILRMRIVSDKSCRENQNTFFCSITMTKEETVLQGMIDKLTEIGRCYGMEMNVEKTK